MSIQLLDRTDDASDNKAKMAIADCDIHPAPRDPREELYPYLSKRWQTHMETYGSLARQGFQSGPPYPKGQPGAMRRDAYPPGGAPAGSSLDFMRAQHLDVNNVQLGILNPLRTGQGLQNGDFSDAYCRAINEWQVAEWTSKEPRLKASLVIPYEDTAASVAEVDRLAGHPDFAQVFFLSRTSEPMGQRRYWPIYEAAVRANLPVAVHAFGYGGFPVSAGGWPSYYIEEMIGHAQCSQALLSSMVLEGVFERFPTLKLILIEGGFAWLPSLAWRLDKVWERNRGEVPHVKRPPSEYIREHVWVTTQPMEEPDTREHLLDTIAWIGWDKLLFATDYPHWDFDDPVRSLPLAVGKEKRQQLFHDNAFKLFGLDGA